MLVTCLINIAAIVFLRTVETKERVKILPVFLNGITQWPCQIFSTLFEVEVTFDLYKQDFVSCKAFYWVTNTILVVNIKCNIGQWIAEQKCCLDLLSVQLILLLDSSFIFEFLVFLKQLAKHGPNEQCPLLLTS